MKLLENRLYMTKKSGNSIETENFRESKLKFNLIKHVKFNFFRKPKQHIDKLWMAKRLAVEIR